MADSGAPEPAATQPVAALVYTTGTTGKPKGVMLSHRNLLFVAAVSSRLRGLAPADLAYGVLPVSHVYGLTSVLLGTLYAGACLRLAPRFTPRAMLDAIRSGGSPSCRACRPCTRACWSCARSMASRRRWRRGCASPTPAARRSTRLKREVESLLGVPLHNGYGLTEAAPTVSQTRLDAPRADTSVGHLRSRASRCVVEGPDGGAVRARPERDAGVLPRSGRHAAVLGDDGWLAPATWRAAIRTAPCSLPGAARS
jgi:long-chain acyl-CoA synthetase